MSSVNKKILKLFLPIMFLIFVSVSTANSVRVKANDNNKNFYISRGEFANILVNLAFPNWDGQKGGDNFFTDLDEPSLNKDSILFLYKKGILRGYPDKTAKSNKPITYFEAFALISRTLRVVDISDNDNNGHWALTYFNVLKEEGFLKKGFNEYENKIITRREAEELLNKIFSNQGDAQDLVIDLVKSKNMLKSYGRKDIYRVVLEKDGQAYVSIVEIYTKFLKEIFHQIISMKSFDTEDFSEIEIYADKNYNYLNVVNSKNKDNCQKWVRIKSTFTNSINFPMFIEHFDYSKCLFRLEKEDSQEGLTKLIYYVTDSSNQDIKTILEKIGVVSQNINQQDINFTVEKIRGEVYIDKTGKILKEAYELRIYINPLNRITLNGLSEYFEIGEDGEFEIPEEVRNAPLMDI